MLRVRDDCDRTVLRMRRHGDANSERCRRGRNHWPDVQFDSRTCHERRSGAQHGGQHKCSNPHRSLHVIDEARFEPRSEEFCSIDSSRSICRSCGEVVRWTHIRHRVDSAIGRHGVLLARDVPAFASRLPDTREAVLILVPLERERRVRPRRIVSTIRRGRHERGGMVVALSTDQQN
jgi:hypothetical protein